MRVSDPEIGIAHRTKIVGQAFENRTCKNAIKELKPKYDSL